MSENKGKELLKAIVSLKRSLKNRNALLACLTICPKCKGEIGLYSNQKYAKWICKNGHIFENVKGKIGEFEGELKE